MRQPAPACATPLPRHPPPAVRGSSPGSLAGPLPPGLAGSGSPDFQQRLLRLWDVPRHLPDLHLTLLVRPARQFTAADQQYCAKPVQLLVSGRS